MDDDRQRENDRMLYRLIGDSGASARQQEPAFAALVMYAWPVLCSWVLSGRIFDECAGKKRPLGPKESERRYLRDRPDAIEDLVQTSLIRASRYFRRCAVTGRGAWDPDGPASLRTYFVGCCVLVFPEGYRAWRRLVPDEDVTDSYSEDDWIREIADPGISVEDDVVSRQAVTERLTDMPPTLRRIVEMIEQGYEYGEIARELGLPSPRAVEGRMRRLRARAEATGEDQR